jgi:hypothetical protein
MSKKQTTQLKKYKHIPLSHVIYVNIDDEVATIFDQIQKKNKDKIYIIAPNRAVIFQSAINLKILKRKSADLKKELILITTDKNGQHHAKQAKIKVYEKLQDITGDKKLNPKPVKPLNIIEVTSNQKPQPVQEKIQQEEAVKPSFKNSILNFPELIEKKYNQAVDSSKQFIYSKIPKLDPKNQKFIITKPNKNLLFSLGLFSLLLFFFVAYISLPNSSVRITPNFLPIEQTVNVTLADADRHEKWLRTTTNKALSSYQMSPGIVENTIQFQPTGFDINGKNAEGEIMIYNISDRDFPLVPFTRFQTDNGIILRSKRFVNLPPGSPEEPSTAVVEVVADALDVNQIPIGDRGNLPSNTKLFIPGLRAETQQEIYGTVISDLKGGVTSKDRIVTDNDLISAEQLAIDELNKSITKKLNQYLLQYNKDYNLNLTLFDFPETFKVTDVETNLDPSLLGQKMPSFDITARAKVSAYAYDQEEFKNIMVNQLKNIKSPDKILTKIDTENIQIKILDTLDQTAIQNKLNEGFIEITATISGVEKYIVDPNTQAGQKLYEKITQNITNLKVSEAKRYVQSLPEIDKVQVTTWPFWAPTLPSNPDNIKIKLNDEV